MLRVRVLSKDHVRKGGRPTFLPKAWKPDRWFSYVLTNFDSLEDCKDQDPASRQTSIFGDDDGPSRSYFGVIDGQLLFADLCAFHNARSTIEMGYSLLALATCCYRCDFWTSSCVCLVSPRPLMQRKGWLGCKAKELSQDLGNLLPIYTNDVAYCQVQSQFPLTRMSLPRP